MDQVLHRSKGKSETVSFQFQTGASDNLCILVKTGLEDAAFAKTVEVNLKGALDLSRLVAQHLMDRGAPGSIINITSVVGLGGTPLQGAYAITKAGLISMTQTMTVEWGSEKIRVNAIAPGFIKTSFHKIDIKIRI